MIWIGFEMNGRVVFFSFVFFLSLFIFRFVFFGFCLEWMCIIIIEVIWHIETAAPAAKLWNLSSKHFELHAHIHLLFYVIYEAAYISWYGFVFNLFKRWLLRFATCPCRWIEIIVLWIALPHFLSLSVFCSLSPCVIKCAKINRI